MRVLFFLPKTLAWAQSAIFIFGIVSGCSQVASQPEGHTANDLAVTDALNGWWKEFTYSPPQTKVGTVIAAHTNTSTKGRVYAVPKHVQTKEEAEDEAEDARYMGHKRALIRGFSVKGQTVTVITDLTRETVDVRDAQELCRDLGSFVWANENRHFGLEDIKVTGIGGELLSSRIGLSGKVQ